jgi:hypothetical protein
MREMTNPNDVIFEVTNTGDIKISYRSKGGFVAITTVLYKDDDRYRYLEIAGHCGAHLPRVGQLNTDRERKWRTHWSLMQ